MSVTCLHTRDYTRIAYQLGHELGHFYIDPHDTNWLIESVCTALSLQCLTALSSTWATSPPFPNWRSYAPSFREYREAAVNRALQETRLGPHDAIAVWVRCSLPHVVRSPSFSRQHEVLCAEVIATLMADHRAACSALTRLGMASHAHGNTDFAVWRGIVSKDEASLVDAIGEVFAHAFDDGTESNRPQPWPC